MLVFHGVDGIGWEALPHELLDEYFQYIKSKEKNLWIATFGDVTKYMRERMNAAVMMNESNEKITVTLIHSLDKSTYDIPLTLKSYIPPKWQTIKVQQGSKEKLIESQKDEAGTFVLYQATPNSDDIELSEINLK